MDPYRNLPWIEWRGGRFPRLPYGTDVAVRLRNGGKGNSGWDYYSCAQWLHTQPSILEKDNDGRSQVGFD